MSKTIDENVVEMKFDNSQFERNVKGTLSTLDKLKAKLNFTGASKGLENINTQSNKVNFNGMSSALDTVKVKFSAGWKKYDQQTTSVQTLVNSTGKSVKEIDGYLEKLMWFSDETSYGFTDMTSALATMTSSGR